MITIITNGKQQAKVLVYLVNSQFGFYNHQLFATSSNTEHVGETVSSEVTSPMHDNNNNNMQTILLVRCMSMQSQLNWRRRHSPGLTD